MIDPIDRQLERTVGLSIQPAQARLAGVMVDRTDQIRGRHGDRQWIDQDFTTGGSGRWRRTVIDGLDADDLGAFTEGGGPVGRISRQNGSQSHVGRIGTDRDLNLIDIATEGPTQLVTVGAEVRQAAEQIGGRGRRWSDTGQFTTDWRQHDSSIGGGHQRNSGRHILVQCQQR